MNPFGVRSFRFQWPADLATSWAFEMENLILGWYILSATGSVEQLVLFASLAWLGSILSPFFGVAGDRFGQRTLLCATRATYAVLASTVTALSAAQALQPWHVFIIAAIAGLIRPSDMVMRNVLVAHTMHSGMLLRALAISRTTSDTARIAGALAGTGSVALVGMVPAYVAVTLLYVAASMLSLGVARTPAHRAKGTARAALAGLRHVFGYVWKTPEQLAGFCMAFLVNLLAYPFFLGLLPYVAKDVYHVGQAELGYLAAAFACGALAGSLAVGAARLPFDVARVMLAGAIAWFIAIVLFGQTRTMAQGLPLLFISGVAQSFCMTPIAALMLRSASEDMRGRVMGMRMLAVWGLPIGLVAAGPVIAHLGYVACTLLYGGGGLAAALAVAYRWRRELWRAAAR
jgi:Na+/melibiose symporter-like transporter